ncbi:hypothetical protein [Micromonospora cathayae]|uniref:BNR repeat-containing family member n=1 Tax=Micromonospora cathayae TaxID=3028804 RepID=A0ABY7ZI92_9ACTN|nr:hypothetical protein [Micromonospora sp. HUAS 3]WDZ82656.1 hypothetical protein PVK37_19505 [Micromonospora sp. HUAS 3]
MSRRVLTLLTAVVTLLLATASPATASATTVAAVSTTIGTTNVTPMWGPQLPKVVHDANSGWYYTATMDGSGSAYPWQARIWKSPNGTSWTLAATLNQYVYQPPALLLDSGNRLWLTVPCYTGGQCYPGVTPLAGGVNQYVYLVRLQFTTVLGDGSLSLTTWNDHSVRTTSAERYYGGIAIDDDRRYVYHAYSRSNWDLYVARFDTWTNTETVTYVASPGVNEAYLYPRVRPGTASGEVWLSFNQTELNTGSSATIHGVQLWRSTDGGATFPSRFMVASCPSPDGTANWCDAVDLVIDGANAPHVLFYKKISGVSHLYYWKGNAGSVTLPGSPVDLGGYDNHAQIVLGAAGERFVFGTLAGAPDNVLRVLRSTTGTSWSTETHAVSGADRTYSPNLMRRESGSFHTNGSEIFRMLLSSRPSGGSVYSRLDFLTYTAT